MLYFINCHQFNSKVQNNYSTTLCRSCPSENGPGRQIDGAPLWTPSGSGRRASVHKKGTRKLRCSTELLMTLDNDNDMRKNLIRNFMCHIFVQFLSRSSRLGMRWMAFLLREVNRKHQKVRRSKRQKEQELCKWQHIMNWFLMIGWCGELGKKSSWHGIAGAQSCSDLAIDDGLHHMCRQANQSNVGGNICKWSFFAVEKCSFD